MFSCIAGTPDPGETAPIYSPANPVKSMGMMGPPGQVLRSQSFKLWSSYWIPLDQ